MNRNKRITISIIGIILVFLALVGVTFGYFLTNIIGNTNSKSLSLDTKNLIVRYEDGDNQVLSSDSFLEPSATPINTKTFSVTNDGDATDYVVVLDNINIKNMATGAKTEFESNDFVYTLECESRVGDNCNSVMFQSELPLEEKGLLIGNKISEGDTHDYIFTLWYLETDVDQSADMNKMLQARINIADIKTLNPYNNNVNSLANKIINNSIFSSNGTKFVASPPSIVASGTSSNYWEDAEAEYTYSSPSAYADTEDALWMCEDGEYDEETDDWIYDCTGVVYIDDTMTCEKDYLGKYVIDYYSWEVYKVTSCKDGGPNRVIDTTKRERVLSMTFDDYGESYYYRGAVKDNYVNFAGMCWRVVRIDGNGNIKLILEDQNNTCDSSSYNGDWSIGTGNYGYTYDYLENSQGVKSASMVYYPDYLSSKTEYTSSMSYNLHNWQKILAKKMDASITDSSTNAQIEQVLNKKLVSGNWCYDDRAYASKYVNVKNDTPLTSTAVFDNYFYSREMYFDTYVRLQGVNGYYPTLKCNGQNLTKFDDNRDGVISDSESNMYVGALTADEIAYAGGKVDSTNYYYYLNNNSKYWWSLSISDYSGMGNLGNGIFVFAVHSQGKLDESFRIYGAYNSSTVSVGFRPSILIKAGTEVSRGTGLKTDPYVIN